MSPVTTVEPLDSVSSDIEAPADTQEELVLIFVSEALCPNRLCDFKETHKHDVADPLFCLAKYLNLRNFTVPIQSPTVVYAIDHDFFQKDCLLVSCERLYFSALVFAVPSGSLPRSVTANLTGGDKELLSLLASPIDLADAPLLLPDESTTTLPSSLTSDLRALTDNVKPFTSAELLTVIDEGIKKVKVQFPQAIPTKITMAAIGYDSITKPGFINAFRLLFQSLQQRKKIWVLGRLNTTSNSVRWFDPNSYEPVPFFPEGPEV